MSDPIADTTAALCGWLSDNGFEYHWEADNRGGFKSRYIFVRKPIAVKIRVSDHKSDRTDKERERSKMLVLDVGVGGKHGMSWQDATFRLPTHAPGRKEG